MNAKTMQRAPLHTLNDAACVLKLCTRTVRRMIERGEIKALRFGRSIRIRDEDLEVYLLRAGK